MQDALALSVGEPNAALCHSAPVGRRFPSLAHISVAADWLMYVHGVAPPTDCAWHPPVARLAIVSSSDRGFGNGHPFPADTSYRSIQVSVPAIGTIPAPHGEWFSIATAEAAGVLLLKYVVTSDARIMPAASAEARTMTAVVLSSVPYMVRENHDGAGPYQAGPRLR